MAKQQYSASDFKGFVVTGKLYRSNKRFSDHYSDFKHAMMINLWNGRVWGVLHNGKRVLLKTVTN